MATKKKVLLEQETPVPENTAPADGTKLLLQDKVL